MSTTLLRQSFEDLLSASLERVSARCIFTGGYRVGGDWALRFPTPGRLKIAAQVSGSCVLRCQGTAAAVRLEPGDIAILDGRHPLVVGNQEGMTPRGASLLLTGHDDPMVDLGGEDTVQIGGHIEANWAGTAMLREVLPPILHVGADARSATVLRGLVEQLFAEMSHPSAGWMYAGERLAQLVLVHVLREFLASAPDLPPGQLRVLVDQPLAPAVQRMHEDPGRPGDSRISRGRRQCPELLSRRGSERSPGNRRWPT
ncbi:cupin domain-containing protein [Kibdelosporangium philippinense]|uniref:Cupin domain-containing protein n=1 Tax=Kibdelosporangium philippinense TaxID=211113 RepID=A0ABS8Z2P2_9PSEU|nr:cupin domain-containing protein [Kibdelosporangium philippinense]MCE7001612.1 cupin domain-containing protein [Kibdelosporangium philippinense]